MSYESKIESLIFERDALRTALRELLARAEADICDPIDVTEIQHARHVLGLPVTKS